MWQEHAKHGLIYHWKKRLLFLQDTLLARSGGITYIPITLVTFFMFCGASWLIFWPATDPARYQCYALTFWFGSSALHLLPAAQCSFLHIDTLQPPFHMLPLEYPPLTLLPFSLPLLLPLPYYQFAFAIMMSLLSVLIYWLLQRYGPRGSALLFAFYIFIGALALAQMRYDLLPALLTLSCAIAAERQRWTMAYIALACGVLLKIYPILFLPPLFLAEQQANGRLQLVGRRIFLAPVDALLVLCKSVIRWRWRNCLLFMGIVLSVTGFFALFDFQGAVISQLRYFAGRPVQIESTGSTVLWLARNFGVPWQEITYNYGSINIISQFNAGISLLGTSCFVLGYMYVLWLQWRRQVDIVQAMIALLLLFMATGKVFSPQYLIWLIPLLAYAGAFDAFWFLFWGAISLQTTILYAFFYSHLPSSISSQAIIIPPIFFTLVAVRNIFFVILTLCYLFNWFQVRQRKPVPLAERTMRPLQLAMRSSAHV